jgi:hypothetical protein
VAPQGVHQFDPDTFRQAMPEWWNRKTRQTQNLLLKMRAGSSPALGTKYQELQRLLVMALHPRVDLAP